MVWPRTFARLDGRPVVAFAISRARGASDAQVTERVDAETVWMPFHFSGRWGGVDMTPYYPAGAKPVILGESINTATTYGYDSVTMMQETKTTVCQIERATA